MKKDKTRTNNEEVEFTNNTMEEMDLNKPKKMENATSDSLRRFFEKVTNISIIDRIFGWNSIRSLSYDAYNEFKSVESVMRDLQDSINSEKQDKSLLKQKVEHQKDENVRLEKEIEEAKNGYEKRDFKYSELVKLNAENEKKIAEYNATEEEKQRQYEEKLNNANQFLQQLEVDRKKVQEERELEIRDEFERKKKTWNTHERLVESRLKEICNVHGIEYLDKEHVPFKGKPDNTIKIAGEFVIFDAKSPQSDDLTNFPTYIQQQAESVKKYVKEENVKKDLFLIVPTNTLSELETFYHNMADYNVYILTPDAIEPVLMSLRKIEDYEFAEQLSPDERENICRILGKFAHVTKRRAQVDLYFFKEFANLWNNCTTLPSDILGKMMEFEKSDKMNPPLEKRAKVIPIKELDSTYDRAKQEARAKEVNPDIVLDVKEE